MQEKRVRSLEEGTATHCSILAWRIPWTEEPGGLQSTGSQESDTAERVSTARSISRRLGGKESACRCRSHGV